MISLKQLSFIVATTIALTACGDSSNSNKTTTPIVEPTEVHIIQPSEIPEYIANFTEQNAQIDFQFEGVKYDINFRDFGEQSLSAIAQFELGFIIIGFDIDKSEPIANINILETYDDGELKRQLQSNNIEVNAEGDNFVYSGTVKETTTQGLFNIRLVINQSFFEAGSSTITVEGSNAMINGTLGTKTYIQMNELIQNNTEVTTLVLQKIDGSINDAINMHTSRLVRNAQLTTLIPADGDVNSGGVDLFAEGLKRTYIAGGKVGVHSWCCIDGKSAHLLPREHSAHGAQLTYFKEVLGKDLGPAFYFFTLNAATFDNIHVMTLQELQTYLIE